MKEAQEPDVLAFKLKDVPLGVDKKGRPYGSAVLVQTDAPAKKSKALTSNQQLGLETYNLAAEKYGSTDDGVFRGLDIKHWRELFYRESTGDNVASKQKAFGRVRSSLVSLGKMKKSGDDLYLLAGSAGADLLESLSVQDRGT